MNDGNHKIQATPSKVLVCGTYINDGIWMWMYYYISHPYVISVYWPCFSLLVEPVQCQFKIFASIDDEQGVHY